MVRKIAIAICSFFILQGLAAQQTDTENKWKFHSLNQAGISDGESQAAFHLQTVNGFRKNNWFAGIGTGLDYYQYKSIPLFAEGIKYFCKTKNQVFVYADAGVNFVWQKKHRQFNTTETYYPGFYGGTGIGYKVGLKNGNGFLLSAGYSYKRVNEKEQVNNICPYDGPCNIIDNYKYDFNRLLIQIGLMF